jgi:asparagine synthase (glutamine-hydrolysing)
MSRFCAVLGPVPRDEILSMGAVTVYADSLCALGALGHQDDPKTALYRVRQQKSCHENSLCITNALSSGLVAAAGESFVSPAISGGSSRSHTDKSLVAVGDMVLLNRAELAADAGVPATSSDGEVLLALYERFGCEGLARVRGMFALAIWDGKHLTLVSDPMGARSVFYAYANGTWVVSSSLRALRRWPRLPVAINYAAVRSFLTCAYLLGDETLLQGVHKLPAGSCIRLHPDGSSDESSYWEPTECPWDPTDPPDAYAEHLSQLLHESTSLCLPTNQDVGVFLSGGLDSSLVAALASRLHDRQVKTYTINFGSNFPNELSYADLAARHCGTKHKVLTYDGRQVVERFESTVALMDCPVGEGLTVPNILLSRSAAEDGLTVILNGEGGDPCFGGPKNIPMLLFELHRSDPSPDVRAQAYLRSHRHCYDDLGVLLSPRVQAELGQEPSVESRISRYLESDRMTHYVNRLMWTNLRLKGPGYMLAKVDYLVASQGIQGRYPLFDRKVVEYSFAIPPKYKIAGTTEKWILKLAVKDLLPEPILERPKSGMRMPMKHWLDGPLRELTERLLLSPRGRSRGIFNTAVIRSWLNRRGVLGPRHGQRLWLALTLEAWLRAYVDTAEFIPEKSPTRKWWRLWRGD